MVRNFLVCLILILAVVGCGQVNVSIDPKSSTEPLVMASQKSIVEATTGSTLRGTTSGGYKFSVGVGSPYAQISQTTTVNGYKAYIGVTGVVANTQ